MIIQINKYSLEQCNKLGVFKWPIWSCGVSEFNWIYKDRESCFIIDGSVQVTTDHEIVNFQSGDFVIFPKDLQCVWKVIKPVRKHYKFG